jgi:arginine kinase
MRTDAQKILDGESLSAQVLTPELYERLSVRTTAHGQTIDDIIASVRANPDSSVGAYAGSADAYDVFREFFAPVISKYHNFEDGSRHITDMDASKLTIRDLDPTGEFINSTRIRVGRNLSEFAFAPAISRDDRLRSEEKIVKALQSLTGDLAGTYYPLVGMDEATRTQLVEDHLLFKSMVGDPYLEAGGLSRDWPEGRGIFLTEDRNFLIWVNEEDANRIISMQNGGNVYEVFDRLSRAVSELDKTLAYAYHDTYGALTACPTNLGTAMRASVHVRLPHFSQTAEFEPFTKSLGLSIRGIHGEHSESEGGVYDISNKRRLGASELELVQEMVDGVKALIDKEKQAASGDEQAAAA